jgi:hypothetical protein
MKRTLKALALVLAITAASAVVSSAAQAASGDFTCEGGAKASCIITLDQTEFNAWEFGSGVWKCTGFAFPITTVTNGTTTIEAHPEYSGCKIFGVGASVVTTGCNYLFHLKAAAASSTDVVCSGTNKITVTPVGISCTVTVGSQTGITGISYENTTGPPADVDQIINAKNIEYTEAGSGCSAPGTRKTGTYKGKNTFTGFEDVGGKEGARIPISIDP